MRNILVVVDMQKDFIDGALGTPEAQAIVPRVIEKLQQFDGEVIYTRDTHSEDYLETSEGQNLPVRHCIKGTPGWELAPALLDARDGKIFDKPTFGSAALAQWLSAENARTHITNLTLVGLCTDICVISNALLIKAFLPETRICVDAACCAGVTPQSHTDALQAMRPCQIDVVNG